VCVFVRMIIDLLRIRSVIERMRNEAMCWLSVSSACLLHIWRLKQQEGRLSERRAAEITEVQIVSSVTTEIVGRVHKIAKSDN